MIHLRIVVENPAENLAAGAYGAGALIRWESDVALHDTFVEGGTVALVAGTTLYDVWHAAGTATTQYRWRLSNAGGSVFGPYSAVFLGSATVTYASIEQLTGTIPENSVSTAAQGRAYACLLEASRALDSAIGWDFLTHDAGEAIVIDTSSANLNRTATRLCVHHGFTTPTKLEVSFDWGTTWTEIATGDYISLPRTPDYEEPYDHIELSRTSANYTTFPVGESAVRLTCQRGYAAPPRIIQAATLAMARQILRGDSTIFGGSIGPEGFTVTGPERYWPKAAWDAIQTYRSKFFCAV